MSSDALEVTIQPWRPTSSGQPSGCWQVSQISPLLDSIEANILILERETDADPDEPDAGQQEISTSWSLFILIILLILALFASYILQTRRIQAVHETVMSIFAGRKESRNPEELELDKII